MVLAEASGVEAADLRRRGALLAAVGPVTGAALRAEGLAVDVEPRSPKMGALYHALSLALASLTTEGPAIVDGPSISRSTHPA